jgi:integrase
VPSASAEVPTFHQYASAWLRGKVQGVLGDKPIDANTESDYRWRLTRHLLPFFAKYRLDEIDRGAVLGVQGAQASGIGRAPGGHRGRSRPADRRGRKVEPLGPSSIRKLVDTLAAILEEVVEDGLIDRNPARGKRMKVRVPQPPRSFLEMDELAVLLDAAEDQDRFPLLAVPIEPTSRTRDKVARLAAAGKRPSAIADELGLAKSTITHHLRQLGAANAGHYLGRRAIVEMLARSSVRVSELCDVRLRDVRLHDPDGSRFRIPDSKTQAGIREVQMTPDLADVLTTHLKRVRAAGHPTGPDAFLFPNSRGGRTTRQRVGKILREAATLANERLAERGRPPLPNTTPPTLRRTYISIALLANGFDVKWVMSQVGHANSAMTMDVYAQLEQRVDRRHGTSFDALLREARGQRENADWATIGPREPSEAPEPNRRAATKANKKPADARLSEVARPRLELGTPRFSVVCSTS